MKKREDPEISQLGKYRVIRPLGAGAMGKVYLAESPDLDQPVALKVVSFAVGKSQSGERRIRKLFRTEQNVAKKLDHPNIIRIYDAVLEENRAWMVMDFVDGPALDKFTQFRNLLPADKAVGIIFKCCLALDHAYRQGVLHRDIKPANIMVDKDWNAKIMDFGLALNFANKDDSESTFITGVGSPAFMSPEQVKGYPLNQQSDIYSLGVVLYQLLTGRLPFKGKNPAQTIYKIVNSEAALVSKLNPNVPLKLDAIVQKALEKDLYSRYRNGADMAQDLSGVRFQIVDDNFVAKDTKNYSRLRKLSMLFGLDEVELWEVMRMGNFLNAKPGTEIATQGSTVQSLAIILEGKVAAVRDGAVLFELTAGEFIGEGSMLLSSEPQHQVSVIALDAVQYFSISPASYELASEDVGEKLHDILLKSYLNRFERVVSRISGVAAPSAAADTNSQSSISMTSTPQSQTSTLAFSSEAPPTVSQKIQPPAAAAIQPAVVSARPAPATPPSLALESDASLPPLDTPAIPAEKPARELKLPKMTDEPHDDEATVPVVASFLRNPPPETPSTHKPPAVAENLGLKLED